MKILALVMTVALLSLEAGCRNRYEKNTNGIYHAYENGFRHNYTFSIGQIETNGEVHEYMMYRNGYHGGMTHLPNCKYCKKGVK